MKQVLRNSVFALAAIVALTFSGNVKANGGNDPEAIAEIKFIGNFENQPLFQLNLLNQVSDEVTISISDLQGNVLYSERVRGTNITKKFAINTEEVGDNTLRVEVRSRNSGKRESYDINRKQNYVIESVVTRVN